MAKKRVAILGGGPAGATLATFCARAGHDVVVYERQREARAVVGESLLPRGNRVLEKLGLAMDGFVEKSGALFVRGAARVRFDFAHAERPKWTRAHQVPRAEFDARLRALAQSAGAEFRFEEQREPPDGFDWRVDASGRKRVWGRRWTSYERHERLQNAAVMRHVGRSIVVDGAEPGDISIFALDGAWFWVIPLSETQTSVGLVTTPGRKGLRWDDALRECPELRELIADEAAHGPLSGHRDFTESAAAFCGNDWALVGDSAQFLDPVFSSGVLFALESAERLSHVIDEMLSPAAYEAQLRDAASLMEPLILGFYTGDFFDLSLMPKKEQESLIVSGVVSLLAGDIFDKGPRMARVVSRRLPDLARRIREAAVRTPG